MCPWFAFLTNTNHEHDSLRRVRGAQVAELLVVNQLMDGRLVPAHRAGRIALEIQGRDLIRQGVEAEKLAGQSLAFAEDELDRLQRLDRPDEPRQDAEHAGLRARGRHLRWGRLGVEAAVARSLARIKNRRLP